ncbi:hypothetical protein BH11VER1_BH11VER1_32240 [soil metagenome]
MLMVMFFCNVLQAQLIVKDKNGNEIDWSKPVNEVGWKFEIVKITPDSLSEEDKKNDVVAKWKVETVQKNLTGKTQMVARVKIHTGTISGHLNKWVTYPGSRLPELNQSDWVVIKNGEFHKDTHWLIVKKIKTKDEARYTLKGKLWPNKDEPTPEWSLENDVEEHRYIDRKFEFQLCLFSSEELTDELVQQGLSRDQLWHGRIISNKVNLSF